MKDEFEVGERRFPEYTALSIRKKDSLYAMGRLIGELIAKARGAGRKAEGPVFCVYYEKPLDPKVVDYELFLPVSGEPDVAKGIAKIGGESCAYLRVKGFYSRFEAAYEALTTYIAEKKYTIIAPPREVYVRGPLLGFLTFLPVMITDIYFPIASS